MSFRPNQAEGIIALFEMPEQEKFQIGTKMVMVADRIQDPGNLGTMYRILDWFGGTQMIILKGTVDPYNSKTIQASMGAIGLIHTYEMSEDELLGMNLPLYSASMEGENIYLLSEKLEKSKHPLISVYSEQFLAIPVLTGIRFLI